MSEPPAVPGPADVDALAAALRADSADLEVYARVLSSSLVDALPPGMVEITRDQSMRDRLAGRPGTVRSLQIGFGEVTLELLRGRAGEPVARAARAVRGVIISSREISVDEWTRLLADQLTVRARDSAAARTALARLLGQSE
ncbi:MAG TPA: hypothetical protein VHV79_02935 [Mycobacteriales bacterium]|nr:hypothetical protein [Mycobacteriales bacterium]